jgi:ankyrin repeat protein
MQAREAVEQQSDQDVNQQDERGNTLLHTAAKEGDVNRVRELIQQGADVNKENKAEYSPLAFAAKYSGENNWDTLPPSVISEPHAEIVKILLENHANPDRGGFSTPLSLAVNAGNAKVVAKLLQVTTKQDLIDRDEKHHPWYAYMLFQAAEKKEHIAIQILTLLKNYGADFNQRNEWASQGTLLHEAVSSHRNIMLKFLLENGATNVDAADKLKCTPLHAAARFGNIDAVKLLLTHGANNNLKNHLDLTPYQVALRELEIRAERQYCSLDDKAVKPYKDVVDAFISVPRKRKKEALSVECLTEKGMAEKLATLGLHSSPKAQVSSVHAPVQEAKKLER